MPTFYTQTAVMHDGTMYLPGSPIDLPSPVAPDKATAEQRVAAATVQTMLDSGAIMTEEQAKEATLRKEAVDAQALTISEKDAEIAKLKAELDAAKAGTQPSEVKK